MTDFTVQVVQSLPVIYDSSLSHSVESIKKMLPKFCYLAAWEVNQRNALDHEKNATQVLMQEMKNFVISVPSIHTWHRWDWLQPSTQLLDCAWYKPSTDCQSSPIQSVDRNVTHFALSFADQWPTNSIQEQSQSPTGKTKLHDCHHTHR